MIDDYKYMYLYKPLYIWMYILRIVLIFGIFLCLGLGLGIRILVSGLDALILPLVRNLYIPLPFQLGCCYGLRL